MDKTNLAVITVCYNAEKEIEKTINSILQLNYSSLEYIIKDGSSTDNTLNIVKKYEEKFKEKNIKYSIVSHPDKGVYDAMNQAIEYVNSKWVIYMNAGDTFFDSNVIQDFDKFFKSLDIGVLYGNTTLSYDGELEECTLIPLKNIRYHMAFCHQASFVRRDLILKYKFDLKYKIAADYDFFLRCYLNNVKFQALERMVCIYDKSGISSLNGSQSDAEYASIHKKYRQGYPKWYKTLRYLKKNLLH
ncbi:glycosyltransferase family 2 protein [Priestia megaterium]|uniref:glycosyltransferase family 2 protein n=1 Tax=Priestia megaterium TaxID=1404 RepID=UPI0039B0B822